MRILILMLAGVLPVFALDPLDVSGMRLVDEVDCASDTEHGFTEYPAAASSVETVLGRPARVFADASVDMKYFAYQLGRGKGLAANRNYFLRVHYPQDRPRAVFILNRGCETTRGFHTGATTGDAFKPPYVNNNSESLDLPLSGRWECWDTLFRLQERFPAIRQPRGSTEYPRDQFPEDGFWLLCMQLSKANDPLSAGVAISRIELFEAPDIAQLQQPVPLIPPGLPKRHLFWREEMADGLVYSDKPAERGYADTMSWYEGKFDLMRFLGMRTLSKDLLEFGHNQGWDCSRYGAYDWVYQPKEPWRWSRLCQRAGELGMDVIPYYEYKGSIGGGTASLGHQRRCKPLDDTLTDYTHIWWSEGSNADVTDPDTFEDLRKMLEITVRDEQQRATCAAVWLRTRVTDLPVSFSDRCIELFNTQTGVSPPATRARLRSESALYWQYRDWWYERRREFLVQLRDYLHAEVSSQPDLLFTPDASEGGKSLHRSENVMAENPALWSGTGATTMKLADALAGHWQRDCLTSDRGTWGGWEWQHSVPPADPARFKSIPGILQTASVNRAYTLDPAVFDAFRVPAGVAAIRHYPLNEHVTTVGSDQEIVGYFVADVDYAGPFVVLPEALAFANGDPRYFGYLASHQFNRGNPEHVRRFNANFLALPALPSVLEPTWSSNPNCIVRAIPTPSNGTFLGVVNVGRTVQTTRVTLPSSGKCVESVTGITLGTEITSFDITLDPCELRSYRMFPTAVNTLPEVRLAPRIDLEWRNIYSVRGAWITSPLQASIVENDPGDAITQVLWTVKSGDPSHLRFEDANAANTRFAVDSPGTWVLTLTVSDRAGSQSADITVLVAPHSHRIPVTPDMARPITPALKSANLFDQQSATGDPPSQKVSSNWQLNQYNVNTLETLVDLGQSYRLSQVWLFDTNNSGDFKVYSGSPDGGWTEIVSCYTDRYEAWRSYEVNLTTRYLKCSMSNAGYVGEIVLYGVGHGIEIADSNVPRVPIHLDFQRGPMAVDGKPGPFEISFTANPLCRYQFETSTDLIHWEPDATPVGSEPFVRRSLSPNFPAHFIRLREMYSPAE